MRMPTRDELLEDIAALRAENVDILEQVMSSHFECDGCDRRFFGAPNAHVFVNGRECRLCVDCVRETGKAKTLQRRWIKTGLGRAGRRT